MKASIGYALTGSFCTFRKSLAALAALAEEYDIYPIFSENARRLDTRFGAAADFIEQAEGLCGRKILSTLPQIEPLGPKKPLDLIIVAPCTGTTLGKLANGIADTAVTFACKAHLRNARPILLAISTNDGLSGSAENLGRLLNRRLYYFVPFGQDDPQNKPFSLVADFVRLPAAVESALCARQIQPILL